MRNQERAWTLRRICLISQNFNCFSSRTHIVVFTFACITTIYRYFNRFSLCLPLWYILQRKKKFFLSSSFSLRLIKMIRKLFRWLSKRNSLVTYIADIFTLSAPTLLTDRNSGLIGIWKAMCYGPYSNFFCD